MTAAGYEDRSPIRVVLADANVLYSRVLRDYLLYAATEGVLEIRWSAAILAEVVEHLAANIVGFDAAAGERLVEAMNSAFPVAEAKPDGAAEALVATLRLPDEDDRHVLAAAVAVDADALCTNNLRDFPAEAMEELGIRLMSADALLSLLVAEFPERMLVAHRLTVSGLPGATDETTLGALVRGGAARAAELMAALLATG